MMSEQVPITKSCIYTVCVNGKTYTYSKNYVVKSENSKRGRPRKSAEEKIKSKIASLERKIANIHAQP